MGALRQPLPWQRPPPGQYEGGLLGLFTDFNITLPIITRQRAHVANVSHFIGVQAGFTLI